ncbi:GNAT family N-acetyltransferase [Streptomyces brasiliensis]|nr:GNAT family N-acetyltransferase [Streptomyces brasiliensis]
MVQVPRAVEAVDTEDMSRVTANFRQYLMGWGEAERAEGDLDHYRSGLAQPQFNGVVRVRSLDVIGPAVTTARARLAGVPWWWWAGPDSPEGTSAALAAHGAVELVSLPLMTRSLDRVADPEEPLPGLRIETAEGPGLLAELVSVYSASIGIDPALEADLVRIEAERADNADIVRLAAVLDGRVVRTTTVITAHGVAGIFLVHVAEAHRRRGIGAALTAAALRTGQERGMRQAALMASPAGEPLYRRFGFAAVAGYRLFSLPARPERFVRIAETLV